MAGDQLSKSQLQTFKPKSQTEISISKAGRGVGRGSLVTLLVHNRIWCCHLACIVGELTNFDKKIFIFRSAFASQIVSLRKPKMNRKNRE